MTRVILVTGAGSGIGQAVAFHFAKLSENLSLVDSNNETLNETAEKCEQLNAKVLRSVIDVTEDEDVKRTVADTVKEFGRLDVVVNCAGVYRPDNIDSANLLENFDRTLAVNLRAILSLVHFATPALVETKGNIVNISSVTAISIVDQSLSYSLSKAGVNQLTKCAALNLAGRGVRMNSVLPGAVQTNILFNNQVMGKEEQYAFMDSIASQMPLQRVIGAEDVANMVAFLASDQAACVTGVCVPVDSGFMLGKKLTGMEKLVSD